MKVPVPRTASFEDLLTRPENLYAAWHKFRNYCRHDVTWVDQIEMSMFEANIEDELDTIATAFARLDYRLSPLRPIPFPKRASPPEANVVRQSFWVSVRDQVAWIAFVNVVGPWIDATMPVWSYGNRLYRSAWIEEEAEDGPRLKIGWYRHSKGLLYRKFRNSWPLFRRHVFLTARQMGRVAEDKMPLEEPEERLLEQENKLPKAHQLPYLRHDFWGTTKARTSRDLYWAGIDLEKFYPRISLAIVQKNLSDFSGQIQFQNDIFTLAGCMLRFPLDLSQWSAPELTAMGLKENQRVFHGIPTGLSVAGFLANVALLEVDRTVSAEVIHPDGPFYRRIAHFRYVDDHIILATSFDDLLRWIARYRALLSDCKTGCRLKYEKTQPSELTKVIKARNAGTTRVERFTKKTAVTAQDKCRFDPAYPTPLMTETLGLVSQLARTEFLLLDDKQQDHFLQELEHLLLTEFPDEEIRRDTRMSFAASMLARCASQKTQNPARLVSLCRQLARLEEQKMSLGKKLTVLKEDSGDHSNTALNIVTLEAKIASLQAERNSTTEKAAKKESREANGIFQLLLKAVREYPEKPRLWLYALEFFRRSGYGNVKALLDTWSDLAEPKRNPLAASYMRSLLLQWFADHVTRCAQDMSMGHPEEKRFRAAQSYLAQILDGAAALVDKRGQNHFYERRSIQLFQCSVGTAISILEKSLPDDVASEYLDRLRSSGKSLRSIDWTQGSRRWADSTDYPLHAWALWADERANRALATEPSPIWTLAAKEMDLDVSSSWHLLAEHPASLSPDLVLKHLITGVHPAAKAYLCKGSGGWMIDAMKEIRGLSEGLVTGHVAGLVRTVLRAIRDEPKNMISLKTWAEWTACRAEDNAHDPRVGEWTALDITRQIADAINDIKFYAFWKKRDPYPINPYNIFLPCSWAGQIEEPLTWERWHTLAQREKNLIQHGHMRRRSLIWDDRYAPISRVNPQTDRLWAPVHAMGLILLGLLRRSFVWPSIWNRKSGRRDWSDLSRAMISRVVCSSHTLAILEACLLSRPKESILLQAYFQEQPSDDDTTYDPPRIQNLSDFLAQTRKAQEILQDYQITVHGHYPRQMIPVNLTQLCRPSQFALEHEDEQHGFENQ